jgi:hypothetical protein
MELVSQQQTTYYILAKGWKHSISDTLQTAEQHVLLTSCMSLSTVLPAPPLSSQRRVILLWWHPSLPTTHENGAEEWWGAATHLQQTALWTMKMMGAQLLQECQQNNK